MERFSQGDKALALRFTSRGRSTGNASCLGKEVMWAASGTPSNYRVHGSQGLAWFWGEDPRAPGHWLESQHLPAAPWGGHCGVLAWPSWL